MKRKSYDKMFKSKVAIEALKADLTIQALASKYEVHPNQVTKWKKQLQDNAEEIFERSYRKSKILADSEFKETELYKNIGQHQVENQFLKKYKELYGHELEC